MTITLDSLIEIKQKRRSEKAAARAAQCRLPHVTDTYVARRSERFRPKTVTRDPMLAIGYVRMSKEEQTLSPEAQIEAMRAFCARTGRTLVGIHQDSGLSGGLPAADRPGLQEAHTSLMEHEDVGALLVAKRDRLARDYLEAGMLEHVLGKVGIRILSVAGEGTDGRSDDPSAFLMRGIIDLFAHYERLLIQFRTKKALEVKKARKERTGSVPLGFQLATDGVKLLLDMDEQAAIANAAKWRAEGMSYRQIGRALKAAGLHPRKRETEWEPKAIGRMLIAHRNGPTRGLLP